MQRPPPCTITDCSQVSVLTHAWAPVVGAPAVLAPGQVGVLQTQCACGGPQHTSQHPWGSVPTSAEFADDVRRAARERVAEIRHVALQFAAAGGGAL